jgi:hypothetical protein
VTTDHYKRIEIDFPTSDRDQNDYANGRLLEIAGRFLRRRAEEAECPTYADARKDRVLSR